MIIQNKVLSIEKLIHRQILKIKGKHVKNYLQEMISNDMNRLPDLYSSLYAFFLNPKGKVMFDSIITRRGNDEYHIECDKKDFIKLTDYIMEYIKKHKIVKANELTLEESNDSIYSIFNVTNNSLDLDKPTKDTLFKLLQNGSFLYKDPRFAKLGYRLVLPSDDYLQDFKKFELIQNYYKNLKYEIGIGEGTKELGCGKFTAIEVNGDFLQCFTDNKAPFLGQEYIRWTFNPDFKVKRRIFPIEFDEKGKDNLNDVKVGYTIKDEQGQTTGKILGIQNNIALSMIKLRKFKEDSDLSCNGIKVFPLKPDWWPLKI